MSGPLRLFLLAENGDGEIERVPREEAQRREANRVWGALLLALDDLTCRAVLRGLPVRAGRLDGFVLRRALRGGRLPHPEAFVVVTGEMLDAVAEAGAVR